MNSLTRRITQGAASIGLAALLVLSAGILADAFGRTFLAAPILGLSDLVELTAPVIVASCFPMALANRQHVTIRFLGRALEPSRGQAVELLGQCVALLVFVFVAWQVGLYTAGLIEYNQFTWLLRVPIWPSWVLTTALLAVCVPLQAVVVAQTWSAMREAIPLGREEDAILHDTE